MVTPIHNVVPGRVRYHVKGLYRRESLKIKLEDELSHRDEITYVSASVLTGNVLVLFDPRCSPVLIERIVSEVALRHAARLDRWREEGNGASATEHGLTVDHGFVPALRRVSGAPAHVSKRERRLEAVPQRGPITLPASEKSWHMMTATSVLSTVRSSLEHGLTSEEAGKSRKKYGRNEIAHESAQSALSICIDQFKSVPVGMLAVGAALSAVSGGVVDAVAIMTVVAINAVIGFFTENEAQKTIDSLKELIHPSVQVRRGGEIREISTEEVLVGDILILKPGMYVAADARVVDASYLTVDESVLTGESQPVFKQVEVLPRRDLPLADRSNMVFGGTLVTSGQGTAVVVAVGGASEIGKIQALVSDASPPETPVERQLAVVGNQLVVVSSIVCGIVFLIGLMRGTGFTQMLKTAISLAVAAVPEGLPAVATTTLALGIKNMRRNKVLFRNLEAVCTIGSVQTVCLDKTGTLTLNHMEVTRLACGMRLMAFDGSRFVSEQREINPFVTDELLRTIHIGVLCNESEIISQNGRYVVHGSPTENALLHVALAAGVDVRELRTAYPRLQTSYRSENRLHMSTVHATPNNGKLVALKGNPVEILALCDYYLMDGRRIPLSEEARAEIEFQNEDMAGDGLRVLGVAYEDKESKGDGIGSAGPSWLGMVGMTDPIRDGVKESIRAFHRAGVRTVMITGDQSATAHSVGTQLALNNGEALKLLDSESLQEDSAMLKGLCKNVNVFARVSPSHKLQIVQSLQAAGEVVAMTGDGINDGPALKAADVGIAFGQTGTDLAREVADVVLEEDDLETLIVALSHGRTIYNNIRKALHYLLSTNLSEILVMFVAASAGIGYPLNAMQLLWINLVSDIFPGLALALEPPEPDVLSRPPRDPQEPIVRPQDYKRIAFEGSTLAASSLASYGYGLMKYGQGTSAQTLAFQSLTTGQLLHAISCRSETSVMFHSDKLGPNKYLTMAIAGSLGMQLLTQLVPGLRTLLGLAPIGAGDVAVIGVTSVIPLLISELTKSAPEEENE